VQNQTNETVLILSIKILYPPCTGRSR